MDNTRKSYETQQKVCSESLSMIFYY